MYDHNYVIINATGKIHCILQSHMKKPCMISLNEQNN